MKKEFSFTYHKYSSLSDLNDSCQELYNSALAAASKAYAPYSEFHVGAAARLDNGQILSANNQECAAFPSGMCAERSLLYYITANYPENKITQFAITSFYSPSECYPCGACREVLADIERRQQSDIQIIMAGKNSASVVKRAKDLLPFNFELK